MKRIYPALPASFCIKRDSDNPLWSMYIKWLRERFNVGIDGTSAGHPYYGVTGSGNFDYMRTSDSFATEITLEIWDACVNGIPEKWAVKRTIDNFETLNAWANKQPGVTGTSDTVGFIHSINYGYSGHSGSGHYHADKFIIPGHELISFEVWEYLMNSIDKGLPVTVTDSITVSDTVSDSTKGELLGWKIKEGAPGVKEIAQLLSCSESIDVNGCFMTPNNGRLVNRIKAANLLDVWFEPVYKQAETIVRVGTFDLRVNNIGIFYNDDENITEYVKSVYDWYACRPTSFGKYDFKIHDVVLSKTGCRKETTTIDEWVKVWEVYQSVCSK